MVGPCPILKWVVNINKIFSCHHHIMHYNIPCSSDLLSYTQNLVKYDVWIRSIIIKSNFASQVFWEGYNSRIVPKNLLMFNVHAFHHAAFMYQDKAQGDCFPGRDWIDPSPDLLWLADGVLTVRPSPRLWQFNLANNWQQCNVIGNHIATTKHRHGCERAPGQPIRSLERLSLTNQRPRQSSPSLSADMQIFCPSRFRLVKPSPE